MPRLGYRILGAAFALAACSDVAPATEEREMRGASALPLYAIATAVSNDDTSTTYVKTVADFDGKKVSLDDAREFAGWSDMKVLGRWVFVSSGEEPIVLRFSVNERGELEPAGRIGFSEYADYADMYSHALISKTKAYLATDTHYVIWNPEELEITGTIPLPELPVRDGIAPSLALDRGMAIRDGKLYHLASWNDKKAYKMTADSRVIITDLESDEISDVLELPCPDLNVATKDDDDNLYFSNWVYSPGATLGNKGPRACAIKIPAGKSKFDANWTLSFAEATGGHEGANLVFAGSNKALFSVFREDKKPKEEDADLFDWLFSGTSWEFASLDLKTRQVTPLPGLGEQSGGYYAYRHDDSFILLAPLGDYSETTYLEVGANDKAKKLLTAPGWATRIYPVDRPHARD